MATLRLRRKLRARRDNPLPFEPSWTPGPAVDGVGVRHNVAVPMSDGVALRADIHYPDRAGDRAACRRAVPRAVIGDTVRQEGLTAGRPDRRWSHSVPHQAGYIELMVDVRGTGASGGCFEMFGDRQSQDGVELVEWASGLPNTNGRVGMFGISYLAINQLFTAAAVGQIRR